MNLLDLLLEPLSYDFMVRALATVLVAAIVCAVLSCWLVLIGWSLMGDAVSHAVLPGVVNLQLWGNLELAQTILGSELPEGTIERVREIRDEIGRRVAQLVDELDESRRTSVPS